ncbi:hypothetical protein MKW98_006560 [Papaver atlanticum]|uniref:MINDY deubiquitinase domain-containing protein n=1 Tax=Papaver atlanticum TaxID=357466 RepID=A0AAD4TAU9_9MAGN|nr:hypothetical protein MKW98_006560 [Papaver atlanticum]
MASEDHQRNKELEKECVYKTKIVQFLGRTTPIILQNDNGPCPLLAICNLLLLRNNLSLSGDTTDVSLQKLLSLVAERLIDSNSNVENKDVGYVENQQQNIGDAIDLLPRLSTGIDVNVQFRRIDDFEFTRECTIFDLLDIPLYHGWIVDPQDVDTANAIGSKSYNTLMGELVALETSTTVNEHNSYLEEDCIDFAAATTATLGVPSPSLSRARSFDDSPHFVSYHQNGRLGDAEEEAELFKALKLSTAEPPPSMIETLSDEANVNPVSVLEEATCLQNSEPGVHADSLDGETGNEHHETTQVKISELGVRADSLDRETGSEHHETTHVKKCESGVHTGSLDGENSNEHHEPEQSTLQNCNISSRADNGGMVSGEHSDQLNDKDSGEPDTSFAFSNENTVGAYEHHVPVSMEAQQVQPIDLQDTNLLSNESVHDTSSGPSEQNKDSDLFDGINQQQIDAAEAVASSLDGSEPMYEGEECILDAKPIVYESREPIYEGEMVLAEQAERASGNVCSTQGDLLRSFFRINASQLTIYGLFCLQEGLKERELCVFFRNNHFSTMFKLNGELYLLATDQGYINQPDLVWEKLNEVNGDTVFMTGNFEEFKLESHGNGTWNEQNAMTSTADYLASIDNSAAADTTLSSDMQLAMALQQQEFDNQPPQRQHTSQQSSSTAGSGGSRLVVGPQVPRTKVNTSTSAKQESKSKDKCVVM